MNAHRDEPTRRLDLIGVIGKIQTPEFPVQLPGMTVFLNLTNLQERYRLAIELIDLKNDERMAGVRQDGDFAQFDPLFVWTEVAVIPGPLTFAHPGRYACRLLPNAVPGKILRHSPAKPAHRDRTPGRRSTIRRALRLESRKKTPGADSRGTDSRLRRSR